VYITNASTHAKMHSVVADCGLLSCVKLTVEDDVVPGSDSVGAEPLCWREGIQYIESRIEILKVARLQNISLLSLSKHLGVKWSHFVEWGESAGESPLLIFTHHRWFDEITSPESEFVALRRDRLAVGDYFAAM
jgi:hypothetical protein